MDKTLTLLSVGLLSASAVFAQTNAEKSARPGSLPSQTTPVANAETQLRNNSIIIFEDNFDLANDTAGLHARGYITVYNGEGPPGVNPPFMQGYPDNFTSYNGADSSYVASRYGSVAGPVADIDNWLVLPALPIGTGDSIVFYARAPLATNPFVDSIRVSYNPLGDTDIYTAEWVELGRFKAAHDDTWERVGFRAPVGGASARFAIRHTVADGGPNGDNSNYIGIDALTVFSNALSIAGNVAAIGMSTYPNPATATLTVTSVVENGFLIITNALGQQVQRQAISGTTNRVNVGGLASGVYCVSIQSDKGMATQKFIKR